MSRPFIDHPWVRLNERPETGDIWTNGTRIFLVLAVESGHNTQIVHDTPYWNLKFLWDSGYIDYWSWDEACKSRTVAFYKVDM